MPCSSSFGSWDTNKTESEERIDFLKSLLNQQDEIVKKLEAGLCAIINELEKEDIADRIITNASMYGMINLNDFWYNHSKDDKTRISKELNKFSQHEQKIILELLNKKNK